MTVPPTSVMRSRRLIACPEAQTGHRTGSNWEVGSGQTDARQCPLWVKSRHRKDQLNVRFTPKSGHRNSVAGCLLCAKSGHSVPLFDLLVGTGKYCLRNDEAECFCSFKIDHQLV